MKKIILFLMLGLTCFSSFAQSRFTLPLINVTPAGVVHNPDTLTDVDTTYLYLGSSSNPGTLMNSDGSTSQYEDVIYKWTSTELTTTTAGYTGTVIAQGSMTGTFSNSGDWVTLISNTTQYNGSSSITVTGTQTGYFILPNNQFKYVRLRRINSSGTQTSRFTGSAYIMPHG